MPHHRTAIRHRVRAVGAALGLVSVVTLSGCAGEEPVEPPPLAAPTTASPSATPTPSPSGPPTLPPEARGTSDKAAIAFVRHWIDLVNYAGDTLDTRPLRVVSAPSCDGCLGGIRALESIRSRGGKLLNHQWTIRSTELVSRSPELLQVRVMFDIAPSQTIERAGAQPEKLKGGPKVYVFDVQRSETGLLIGAIVQ